MQDCANKLPTSMPQTCFPEQSDNVKLMVGQRDKELY